MEHVNCHLRLFYACTLAVLFRIFSWNKKLRKRLLPRKYMNIFKMDKRHGTHQIFSKSTFIFVFIFFLCYVWRDQIIFYGVLDLFSSSSFGKRKRPQFKHEQYSMWNVLESNSWHSYMLMGFYDCSQEEQPQQQQSITALYVAVIVWFDVIRQ